MKIIESPDLSAMTTMRLGGTAIAEIRLEQDEDFALLPAEIRRLGGEARVLGGGSNLLVRDGELPLVLLRPPVSCGDKRRQPIIVDEDEKGQILVHAAAGLPLPRLVSWCMQNGLSGLEGLVGVPGHLGGAIAMNAGAFGCSTAPLVKRLEVFTLEQGLHMLGPDGWEFAYRRFALTEPCAWSMIVSADLALSRTSAQEVRKKTADNLAQKIKSQPVEEYTAGCVFKNPEQRSAGQLLDAAGVKGLARGAFHFSCKHANFLVHDKNSDAPALLEDALCLIEEAQQRVLQRFDVALCREVMIWP